MFKQLKISLNTFEWQTNNLNIKQRLANLNFQMHATMCIAHVFSCICRLCCKMMQQSCDFLDLQRIWRVTILWYICVHCKTECCINDEFSYRQHKAEFVDTSMHNGCKPTCQDAKHHLRQIGWSLDELCEKLGVYWNTWTGLILHFSFWQHKKWSVQIVNIKTICWEEEKDTKT